MEPKHSQFPPIVGLAGTFASGKDTLARDLVKRGHYVHFSTSDMVRAEASRLYGSTERPVLARTADELRHRDGAGVFAARALEMAGVRPVIVSGIRSLGEMDEIRRAGGAIVFIDAPVEIRYERMRLRQRDEEVSLSLEQFAANEQKELHSGDGPADFNLRDIKAGADIVIENNLPIDDFIAEAERRLADWQAARVY